MPLSANGGKWPILGTQSRYTIIIIYEVSTPFENTSAGKSYSGLKLCLG